MVRFILDLAPRTHLAIDHMKELNLLQVSDRAKQLKGSTMHTKFSTIRFLDTFRITLLRPGTDYNTREAASGTLMCLMSRGLRAIPFIILQLRIGIVYQIT